MDDPDLDLGSGWSFSWTTAKVAEDMTRNESKPHWRQPRRWLVLAGLLVGVCIVFASLPTTRPETLGDRVVGHWSSVLPPIVAVAVALCFHTLVGALIAGFVTGCLLTYWPDVLTALPRGARAFIWVNLQQQFNLYIFGFLFALIGMIHVAYRGGGIHGLVRVVERVAKGPRSTKVATFLAGLVVFFDDYSNTVVVGSTMRALSDKWRISREKLAYIVDSTAAPVAGLALLSTWIAFEVFLLNDTATGLGLREDGYAIFVTMIPFRFYCWGTLLFVILTSALGRDFGPMYTAECRAAVEGKLLRDGARPLTRGSGPGFAPPEGAPRRWFNAVLPLGVVVAGTLGGILVLGRAKVLASGSAFSLLSSADWRAAFGMVTNPEVTPGGAMKVLFCASLAGGFTAVALVTLQRILTWQQALLCYCRAIPTLGMAFFILLMAWGMSKICTTGVHTDTYLICLMGERVPLTVFPLLVFLVASGMAFATGTSFGTMGILIPMVLPLAHALGAYEEPHRIVFWLASAAILDGAIFGDHCSPISDTTVLSSIAAGCDHIDHVETQIPYALTVMGLAALFGYAAVSLGMPGWIYFALFPLAVTGILFALGRPIPATGTPAGSAGE